MKLLTTANTKLKKGSNKGYLTASLEFVPHRMNGLGINLCPKATKGCMASCIISSGFGNMPAVKNARLMRTRFFLQDQQNFLIQLQSEIEYLELKAKRDGLTLCVRLNTFSDIDWINVYDSDIGLNMFDLFPHIQFYDYTKVFKRLLKPIPSNYHLTFSASETNSNEVTEALELDFNVAVAFQGDLPNYYRSYLVVDGDDTDLRFLSPKNVIIGLKAKGRGRQDKTGFIQA